MAAESLSSSSGQISGQCVKPKYIWNMLLAPAMCMLNTGGKKSSPVPAFSRRHHQFVPQTLCPSL